MRAVTFSIVASVSLATLLVSCGPGSEGEGDGIALDDDDIGGVVTSADGPEGGQGSKPIVVHFQVRPNPLAH